MTFTVPETLEEALSPDWLSDVLGRRFPGLRVSEVVTGPIDSRVSTNVCFGIRCQDGLPADLPAQLCLKGYFGEAASAAQSAGQAETFFYRDLAALTGIRTLRPIYADVDVRGSGIVITADVTAEGGTFSDPRVDHSADQVAESLDVLADLHAAMWLHPACTGQWLRPRMDQLLHPRALEAVSASMSGPTGTGVPDEVRDADRIVAAYRAVASEVAKLENWTLMHGDAHVGNLLFDSAGAVGFLDWQLVQRGAWYVDVGYHIASAMSVDERRRSERTLLEGYLDRLAAAGVPRPDFAAAWAGLKRGIAYGLFLWSITSKVNPDTTALLLRRIGTAAHDHEVLSAGFLDGKDISC